MSLATPNAGEPRLFDTDGPSAPGQLSRSSILEMLMVGAAFAPGTCQTSSRKSPLRSALFRGTGFPGYFMLLALVDEAERDKLLPVALLLKELLPDIPL